MKLCNGNTYTDIVEINGKDVNSIAESTLFSILETDKYVTIRTINSKIFAKTDNVSEAVFK